MSGLRKISLFCDFWEKLFHMDHKGLKQYYQDTMFRNDVLSWAAVVSTFGEI